MDEEGRRNTPKWQISESRAKWKTAVTSRYNYILKCQDILLFSRAPVDIIL